MSKTTPNRFYEEASEADYHRKARKEALQETIDFAKNSGSTIVLNKVMGLINRSEELSSSDKTELSASAAKALETVEMKAKKASNLPMPNVEHAAAHDDYSVMHEEDAVKPSGDQKDDCCCVVS